jgi:hypothetical protein
LLRETAMRQILVTCHRGRAGTRDSDQLLQLWPNSQAQAAFASISCSIRTAS